MLVQLVAINPDESHQTDKILYRQIANMNVDNDHAERHHIAVAASAIVGDPANDLNHQSAHYCLLPRAVDAHVVLRCAKESLRLETYSAGENAFNERQI